MGLLKQNAAQITLSSAIQKPLWAQRTSGFC